MKNKLLDYLAAAALIPASAGAPLNQTYEREPTAQENISHIEAKLQAVSRSTLPKGIAGFVLPPTQTGEGIVIRYGSDFQSHFSEFVKYHELWAHAYGIDGSPSGEYWADAIAAERTGRPELIRGPFYRPPLV